MSELLKVTSKGIYCPQADVYIDPWKPVKKALITHGHSDHARYGSKSYLCHQHSINILKSRLGNQINVQGVAYGQKTRINTVDFTFYPAGHIIGSAQILADNGKERWVVSGDYNNSKDSLISEIQPVKCDYFISECTFGLPVFTWDDPQEIFDQIQNWWIKNQKQNKASVITAYSLGKAQRIIQNINHEIGPVYTHRAVENMNEAIRTSGIPLKPTALLDLTTKQNISQSLIVIPPGAADAKWLKDIKQYELAFASGWMAIRGAKRRRGIETGFVLSDHSDWQGLNSVIKETGAQKVYVTHGYTDIFCKWLNSQGQEAAILETNYVGETIEP